jgi:Na+/proline symporter
MSSSLLFVFVIGYFLVLLGIAWRTSRHSNNDSFFIGNRSSSWMLVAFGMIGTTLSGVTFVSVPGTVGVLAGGEPKAFGYLQVIIGNWIGCMVIAFVLLPLYYKLNLTSIYRYLQTRFGPVAYRTGALFFLISRTVGATARLYLVIDVLYIAILRDVGVSFWVATLVILLMILLYTFEGGVRTIVYTDTLQTTFMLLGLVVCIVYILQHSGTSAAGAWEGLQSRGYSKVFDMNWRGEGFFLKQIVGGMFIMIAMTGLDQEMMQKNISVRNLRDSQKNFVTFSFIMVLVAFLFLLLGGLLYGYGLQKGAIYQGSTLAFKGHAIAGDDLFPTLALHYMPQYVSIIFIIGLISALFPSADGALTALTSSFCIDLLDLKNRPGYDEKRLRRTRMTVHLCFAVVFLLCILVFKWVNKASIIYTILGLAGYTYGPLLGLFGFGILTRRKLPNSWTVTALCLAAPVCCYFLSQNSARWFSGFHIGLELLLINGLLTFLGLWALSRPAPKAI